MTTGSNGIALESHVLGDCTRKRQRDENMLSPRYTTEWAEIMEVEAV
ncbi:DUF4113 domain-containing protein [Acetobacter pasteurianus]